MRSYQESLKAYRDNQNTMDYAVATAKAAAKKERDVEIAKRLKQRGLTINAIAEITDLTREEIEKIK